MANLSKKLTSEIKSIIDRMLDQYEIEKYAIRVENDASGDEAIFVELWYRLDAREFDPSVIGAVQTAVSRMLQEHDEVRFPYIRHHLPEGQKVKEA